MDDQPIAAAARRWHQAEQALIATRERTIARLRREGPRTRWSDNDEEDADAMS